MNSKPNEFNFVGIQIIDIQSPCDNTPDSSYPPYDTEEPPSNSIYPYQDMYFLRSVEHFRQDPHFHYPGSPGFSNIGVL